jgi:hypothetical protein
MQLTAFSGASNNDSPVATDGTRRKWCVSIERSHVTPGLEEGLARITAQRRAYAQTA